MSASSSRPHPPVVKAVKILDKYYQVNCPPEQYRSLEEAALFLDAQMCQIRDSGRVIGMERILIMAALNITNDYLVQMNDQDEYVDRINQRLDLLRQRMDESLAFLEETDMME